MTTSDGNELFGLDMTFSKPPTGMELAVGLVQAATRLQETEDGDWVPEVLTATGNRIAIDSQAPELTCYGLGAETLISLVVAGRNLGFNLGAPDPETLPLVEVAGTPFSHFVISSLIRTILIRPYYDPARFPDRPRPDGRYGAVNMQLHQVYGALFRSMRNSGYGPE